MSALAIFGWSAVAVVVVCWIAISFTAPSPRREIVEWLGATGLYVALACLFGSLTHEAWVATDTVTVAGRVEVPRLPMLIAFGFLFFVFSSGLLIASANFLRSFGAASSASNASATN